MRIVYRDCEKCRDKRGHEVSDEGLKCRDCGSIHPSSFQESHTVNAWTDPILSDAAGIHPDQIPEAKAKFPHHNYTEDGRMIFRSKRERKRHLKDIGLIDKDAFS